MSFLEGQVVYLNEKAQRGLPNRVGEVAVIDENLYGDSLNFDYKVQFEDSSFVKVRESELNKLTEEQMELLQFVYRGNEVLYVPTEQRVIVSKVDLVHNQVEVDYLEGGTAVVDIDKLEPIDEEETTTEPEIEQLGKFTQLAFGIGEFTDMKNQQYGSSVDATYGMMKVLMERYTYDEENYLMPKDLLKHLLLMVRVMDKQNRIFNNPSGKGDSESPWRDITGYGLIGIDMVEGK